MYPVTVAYKTQMEQTLRNPSHIRIVFGVTDPDAPSASTITANQSEIDGTAQLIASGLSVASTYQSLERNRFVLDGRNPLPPSDNFTYQGWVSHQMSTSSNTYLEGPILTIQLSTPLQFAALTIYFDTIMGDYAAEFSLVCYYNDNEVLNKTYQPTSPIFVTPDHIPVCTKMVFTFTKSSHPYRRVRVSQLIYGVVSILEDKDVTKCEQAASMDIVSSNLPDETFSFTIMDTEQRYDPENPQGVWEYLESRQPVAASIGYELNDGSVEWLPWCNTYSTGDIQVSRGGVFAEVTVQTQTLLQQLTQTYTQGIYRPAGVSLATLAEEVMTFAGYPNILTIDDSLNNIITAVPLPEIEVNRCLQLIANAGMCVLATNRSGAPVIRKVTNTDTVEDFAMTKKKMKDKPQATKYPVLRKLTTSYRHIGVTPEVRNLVENAAITDANHTAITFSYAAATDQSVTVSTGLTLHSATHYAQSSILVLTGSGTVTIQGKALDIQSINYVKVVHDVGEDLEISNELIDSYANAQAYADWVASCEERRIEYAVEDRGYPELDLGDTINITTNFDDNVPVTIMQKKLTYTGAISGSGVYLTRGDT